MYTNNCDAMPNNSVDLDNRKTACCATPNIPLAEKMHELHDMSVNLRTRLQSLGQFLYGVAPDQWKEDQCNCLDDETNIVRQNLKEAIGTLEEILGRLGL